MLMIDRGKVTIVKAYLKTALKKIGYSTDKERKSRALPPSYGFPFLRICLYGRHPGDCAQSPVTTPAAKNLRWLQIEIFVARRLIAAGDHLPDRAKRRCACMHDHPASPYSYPTLLLQMTRRGIIHETRPEHRGSAAAAGPIRAAAAGPEPTVLASIGAAGRASDRRLRHTHTRARAASPRYYCAFRHGHQSAVSPRCSGLKDHQSFLEIPPVERGGREVHF
jgi:hypothetical protein